MSDNKEGKKSLAEEFWSGYEEQDAQIRADKKSAEENVTEGLATGASEAVFHPFRWFLSLLN